MPIKNIRLIIYSVIVFLIISQHIYAEEFPKLQPGDFSGLVVENEQNYDGASLWGYINGGADLYLEYGFTKLLVQQVKWKGQHFKVEIFQMNNAAAAFGIFSIFQYNCTDTIGGNSFSCSTAFQSKIAKGRFYFSVINEKGNPALQKTGKQITAFLAEKVKTENFVLPVIFQDTLIAPFSHNLKLILGKLGIQNGIPEWSTDFENFDDYRLFVMEIQDTTGLSQEREKVKMAMMDFSTANDCNKYLTTRGFTNLKEKHQEIIKDNHQFAFWKCAEKSIILVSYQQKTAFQKKLHELIKQQTH